MADTITRVDYYSALVPDKAGEAARILTALEQAGVNLIAFSGFPEGRKSQLDFIAADGKALVKAAKAAGVALGRHFWCRATNVRARSPKLPASSPRPASASFPCRRSAPAPGVTAGCCG